MRHAVLAAGLIVLATSSVPAQTYDIGEGNYSAEAVEINPDAVPVQTEEAVTPVIEAAPAPVPPPVYETKKIAVLQALDKVTGRIAAVSVPVGQPQAVGPLFIDVKTCQKTPPDEQPEAAAFLQVWEAKPIPKTKQQRKEEDQSGPSQWVFSGWMFASSPSLSSMNHPIYDVLLKDCVDKS
jgi:hypothetical protein